MRGRQLLEEEATLADSLAPTGDADKDKRAKKRPVPSIVIVIF
jgi:transcription initiation factor TFIID subunit 1